MKILHVSTAQTWRGGEQQLLYLTKGISAEGISQVLVTPIGSVLSGKSQAKNVQTIGFTSRLSLPFIIANTVRKYVCSIIHVHDSHAHTAAVVAAALLGMNKPIIVSRRVDFKVSNSPFSRWKYRHASIRKIICVSDAVRTVMRQDIKDRSLLRVVYDGVEVKDFFRADRSTLLNELGIPHEMKLVGNVSALADHKDHPTFLRAAAELVSKRKDIRFLLAGAGPEESNIRELITKLGLQKHVLLLGFRSDPIRVISSLDVFMMTSKTEGLGSVVLDAFSCGTPVVATDAGGLPELVENGKTGLLVPVSDHQALASAVNRLLDEKTLAQNLTIAARAKVQEMSYKAMCRNTLDIYREVVD
ncbi:MAG: glycosyltransferase [Bacteroidota bacterium]